MMLIIPRPSLSVPSIILFKIGIVVAGKIVVKKIHTLDNPTDMLTKPLPIARFKHCLK